MIILIKALQLILSLSILVIVHEFGHFIAARIFKTKVEKFYLFFDWGFSLLKFKKGETEYGIGWLPLGGYVKIAGMVDESMDKEQMKLPPQPWEFRSKPAWQRLIIMMGGIIMNVILGIFIYSMILFAWGEEYIPLTNMQNGVSVDSTAMRMGLQNGDKIIAVDGNQVEKITDVFSKIVFDDAKTIQVERAGEKIDITIAEGSLKEIIATAKGDLINPRFAFYVDSLEPGSGADKAKLLRNDQIIAIDGISLPYYDLAKPYIVEHKGKSVSVTLLRQGDTIITPISISSEGALGVYPIAPEKLFGTKKFEYGFWASFPAGYNKTWTTLGNYVKQFKLIFSPEVQGYKQIGGFITMGKVMSPTWNWQSFWSFSAFLSIALAFMNFLPIPALDGGHVLFTLYEMVTRRKPSDKFLEYAQVVGMVFLLALMVFANGNDIIKLFR